ncbi:MAG: 6-pyruvoyl-tetrahydropterin synthase related domain, rane family protein [Clostridia bacterium]|jgi:hypothetical protein|nr:6-pyruvoyl-tetrahydropterin synthase related domain, rane family protein [Clostridia bacterium]
MNTIRKIFEKEKVIICLIVIISLFPLFTPGFFYSHDGVIHLFRTVGAYENITNFDFLNRIYYNMIDGLGYGWGIFYPPISAVLPAIFMVLGFSLFTAEKLFIIVTSILAGLFAYKLFNELYKNKFCSLLASIIYILAPFKMSQIIVRGAFGEILLFTFLPLVILGLIKIINKEYKYKYYFIIGVCGIVYSHIISTVYTTIFVLLFLLLNIKSIVNKKTLLELGKTVVIIVLLCLPILVPLAEHQIMNIYNSNSMMGGNVVDSIVHFGQLIGSSMDIGETGENTSYLSNKKEMSYMIGLTPILILTLLPFAFERIKQKGEKSKIIKYSILLLITIFMMTTPFIWNKVGIIDVIQFPWRLLTFSVLFISIIAGYVLKSLLTKENEYSFLLFILGFSFIFIYFVGGQIRFAKTLNAEFDFNNQELSKLDDHWSIANSLGYSHDYLPKELTTDILKVRGTDIKVLEGTANIVNMNKEKNILNADIVTNFENINLELPYIYYKGYTVKIDGIKTDYNISGDGFIKVNIKDAGNHTIYVKYTGTIIYNICDLIAVIVLIVSIINVIKNKKLIKNSKEHEIKLLS